jgi:hypothetical protein
MSLFYLRGRQQREAITEKQKELHILIANKPNQNNFESGAIKLNDGTSSGIKRANESAIVLLSAT